MFHENREGEFIFFVKKLPLDDFVAVLDKGREAIHRVIDNPQTNNASGGPIASGGGRLKDAAVAVEARQHCQFQKNCALDFVIITHRGENQTGKSNRRDSSSNDHAFEPEGGKGGGS
jgi:hypothetical protein